MVEELRRLCAAEFGVDASSDDVVASVERLAERARRQHGVRIPAATFVPRWAASLRHARTQDDNAMLSAVATDDVYLTAGVLAGQSDAVETYRALIGPDLDRVVRRLLPENERVEARQELETRILVGDDSRGPALEQYRGSGGVRAWSRAVATRAVIDMRRRRDRRPQVLPWVDEQGEEAGDTDFALAVGEHVAAVRDAMRGAFAKLSVRQRNLIRQSVLHRMTIDELGALYGAHRATTARWVQRARADLSRHLEENFAERVGATPSAAASLLRSLRSKADVSIRSFLPSALESEHEDA
ncbi:MAG: sigma-70 family RNA polymerase sigma factor [Nannocystales bacterium]